MGDAEKKSCCTKRRLLILLGVVVVIGIGLAIAIPLVLPEVTKKQALDSLDDLLDISDTTRSVLSDLNTYITVALAGLGPSFINSEERTDEEIKTENVDLGWIEDEDADNIYGWSPKPIAGEDPTDGSDDRAVLVVKSRTVSNGFSYKIINQDDLTGDQSGSEVAEFLINERFVPLRDNFGFITDEETLTTVQEDLRLEPLGIENGYFLPIPYHEWEEMASDEAISRLFWYGIGTVLILGPEFSEIYEETDNGTELTGFELDMESLSSLSVRDGYLRYGFRIRFDPNQQLVSIYDTTEERDVLPDEGDIWELAKFRVKQTMLAVVTAREHLQWSHLIGSNSLARANTLHLPPNHPLRRLLTIFTFNTNSVNTGAEEFLTPELGWIHRMTGWPYSSLKTVFDLGYAASNIFEPFRDVTVGQGVLALSEAGKFPYLVEGREYFTIVRNLVLEWFASAGKGVTDEFAEAFYNDLVETSKGQTYEMPAFSKDNLIDHVTQLIWVVTAYHELVGTVVDYTQDPDFCGFRAVENRQRLDTEGYILSALLTGLTGLREPGLIANFTNFIGVGGPEWEVPLWEAFQGDLADQSAAVAAANADREAAGQPAFNFMDPARFECAISL